MQGGRELFHGQRSLPQYDEDQLTSSISSYQQQSLSNLQQHIPTQDFQLLPPLSNHSYEQQFQDVQRQQTAVSDDFQSYRQAYQAHETISSASSSSASSSMDFRQVSQFPRSRVISTTSSDGPMWRQGWKDTDWPNSPTTSTINSIPSNQFSNNPQSRSNTMPMQSASLSFLYPGHPIAAETSINQMRHDHRRTVSDLSRGTHTTAVPGASAGRPNLTRSRSHRSELDREEANRQKSKRHYDRKKDQRSALANLSTQLVHVSERMKEIDPSASQSRVFQEILQALGLRLPLPEGLSENKSGGGGGKEEKGIKRANERKRLNKLMQRHLEMQRMQQLSNVARVIMKDRESGDEPDKRAIEAIIGAWQMCRSDWSHLVLAEERLSIEVGRWVGRVVRALQ
ncbi:uncharacterized protein FA14DRAFT_160152 [Meira miltonrushii]|uniref:Uncharacterized protein n=1 Tax=Meira miltonrushii TaxID=1280837 RepID=A0A316VAZ0_9BASI|nr:uncharacterized protein FA14DRAFT_160152 [Meira miltonrushii]PWN34630.1 hypothetical protein FA14DRAFT_160152 [Meira miltonrushii]